MSELHSDNLLLFAWNLAWLLMLSVGVLFVLICRKHYQRYKRYRTMAEIERLLVELTDPELFRETHGEYHGRLLHYYEQDYLDLLYAWARQCQMLPDSDRQTYCNNSARCGLFDRIPESLSGNNPAHICIALEVCGLAGMAQYTNLVERYTWLPIFAPFACHALVRMQFEEGMESLFRAYGHRYINNAELLTICSDFDQRRLTDWASQTAHWPLPIVLHEYWIAT